MEQLGPVGKGLVGGDNRAGLLVAIGDEPEKEITFLSVDRRITDLVHDHQSRFVIASAPAFPFGMAVFFQLSD